MLVRDPALRASAAEVLSHPWVRPNGIASSAALEPEVLTRLRRFAAMNKLKKVALQVIAANLPLDEITGLSEMFHSLDKDGSGTITAEEMQEGLRTKGARIPAADLQRIMDLADINGDGKVDYEEFLAATVYLGKLEREEHLYEAFKVWCAQQALWDGWEQVGKWDGVVWGVPRHTTPHHTTRHLCWVGLPAFTHAHAPHTVPLTAL